MVLMVWCRVVLLHVNSQAMVIATRRFIDDPDVVSTALENLSRLAEHSLEYRQVAGPSSAVKEGPSSVRLGDTEAVGGGGGARGADGSVLA